MSQGKKNLNRYLPSLEVLEDRTTPAGNVTAIMTGGSLFITGDHEANRISISSAGGKNIAITPLDGTTRINGVAGPIILGGYKHGVNVWMGGGNDLVIAVGLDVKKDLRIDMGWGNNTLIMNGVVVKKTATVNAGAGNDHIMMQGARVKKSALVDAGPGNDLVNIANSSLGRGSVISGGGGVDVIGMTGNKNPDRITVAGFATTTAAVVPHAADDVATVARGDEVIIPVAANDGFLQGSLLLGSIAMVQAPRHGTATPNANGTITYVHVGSGAATDSFTYIIRDLNGVASNAATVRILIDTTNSAPVAANDTANVDEGGTVVIDVLNNDVDPNGDLNPGSIVIVQAPAHGTATPNANGTVTYTHNGSETTSESFTYAVRDLAGNISNVATVNITIVPVNDPPLAVDDTAEVLEGGTVIINVVANDSDPDSTIDLTSVVIVTPPTRGTATPNPDGTVTYTHNGSETLTDSFTYTIRDAQGATSNVATVSITIIPVNDPPVANDDIAFVQPGSAAVIDVAANDVDAENALDLTSIVIVQAPAHGQAIPNANGTVTYLHDGSATTTDSFTYTIRDAEGLVSNVATVSIVITLRPIALDDTAVVDEGGSVVIDVAANDSDPDGTLDLTSITIITPPAHGQLILNGDGTITYIHDGSESTSDQFTYTIKDNVGAPSNVATVVITINPVNDAPVAGNDTALVEPGGTVVIDVAANDTDVDSALDLTSIVIVQGPLHGTATVNPDGTVTYVHDGSESRADSFTYTIKDVDGAESNIATVNIVIDLPPVANPDEANVNEGGVVIIPVAANDTDPDSALDLASIVIVQAPAHGTAMPNVDGTITYTHDGSETLTDTFTYTIRDVEGAVSNVATVTITVNPVNDPPTANNDLAFVVRGGTTSIPVAANDTDPDSAIDLASITIIQQPAHGTVTINADGTVTYTHNGSPNDTDTFTYTIRDAEGAVSNIATVTVTVNLPPVAVNDLANVDEGGTVVIPVAANDSDPDGELNLASIVILAQPLHGTATPNPDGTVTYLHDGSETVADSFTYTIRDTRGATSNIATVTISINPVNDPPIAQNDAAEVARGGTQNIAVAANDSDVDGNLDLASILIVQAPAHGTATPNPDGTVTYVHDGSETTSDTFTYTIKDNDGATSNIATVTLTITA